MKRKCFVCMPLCDETVDLYGAIVKEIEETLGGQWQCSKADDTRRPGMIDEKVVCSLLNSDLVVAVISDSRPGNVINPNVMYELGIAHSFRKPAIVVADDKILLPFDIRSVETIQVNFSGASVLSDLRQSLRRSLRAPGVLDDLEGRRIARNPVTTQLSDAQVFVEDLPWLWGYCKVLRREREAETVWEITRDLYWAGEALFFSSLKEAIRNGKKHYFMVEADNPAVLENIERIKNSLREFGKTNVDRLLHFIAVKKDYFVLWPIAIVLYDAHLVTRMGGIICEPMQSQVGNDSIDDWIRKLYAPYAESGDLGGFEKCLLEMEWTEKRKERTFDIWLADRVVKELAVSFKKIWNEKILEESSMKTEDEKSTFLSTWLIGR